MLENIQGWMVTAIVVVLAFLANLVDTRRKLQSANERQDEIINKHEKELTGHKESPVSHTLYLLTKEQYKDDKIDVKESLVKLESAVKAVHKRLDDIKNGQH